MHLRARPHGVSAMSTVMGQSVAQEVHVALMNVVVLKATHRGICVVSGHMSMNAAVGRAMHRPLMVGLRGFQCLT